MSPTRLPAAQLPPTQLPPAQLLPAQLPLAQLPSAQLPLAQLASAQLASAQRPPAQGAMPRVAFQSGPPGLATRLPDRASRMSNEPTIADYWMWRAKQVIRT